MSATLELPEHPRLGGADGAARPAKPGHDLLAAMGLLLAAAAVHLVYLLWNCPLDLSGDEAHYWEWSRRLDWSYYSKGPLVAYLIALGRAAFGSASQRLLGNEALAVRSPAMVLAALTGLGLYKLAAQTLRSPRVALWAVALLFTIPILTVGGMLMTIDAPLVCCYVWALVCCARALCGGSGGRAPRERAALVWWAAAGVLIALGILAKYSMVLIFPAVGLALLTEPEYRAQLRRPGPYLALAVGLGGFVPIVIWNAQHGWLSFRHVAGQAGVSGGAQFDPAGLLDYVLGQWSVIGAVWFPSLLGAAYALARRSAAQRGENHEASAVHLLLYAAIVPFALFAVFSVVTKVQPNWPVMGLLPGLALLALWLRRRLRQPATRRATRALIVAGAVTGAVMVVFVHRADWFVSLLARVAPQPSALNSTPLARLDPTARLRGWRQLGAAVGRRLREQREAGRAPFLVADDYQVASLLAFYCPGQPDVYCLQSVLGERLSQYDLWESPINTPERFVGRPCLYVGAQHPELFGSRDFPDAALPGARALETVEHRVRGAPYRYVTIYACERYAGLPARAAARAGTKY